ncbi:condensation domain-containing protein [Streptomyces pyxinae]|uniref:condensation domain-containing protein n=1 Tax=Streptomyces pyxinae TaxID=2970734 RepID=UPI00286826CC|nr:condensation domain-containing protein [Streptomyces sp. LP05-1]
MNPTPLADHCHVPPPATVADVHAALAALTARHEALRTTVDPLRPVQYVHRADWAPLPIDHVEVPAADADTLEAATAALAARPIDPERNPPWLARVLLEAGRPRAVVLAAHHVVIDGWGLAVLLDQLHDHLRGAGHPRGDGVPAKASAQSPGTAPPRGDGVPAAASTYPPGTAHPPGTPHPPGTAQPLDTAHPPGTAHPLDAAAAQHPERARAAEREWLTRLAANPTGVLAPFGGTADGEGRHRLQYRSVEAYEDLDRVARRHRVSPETVVLAALAHEVATRTGEHRFLASVVVSNRARAALRNSIGVLALTVPVQIDLRPGAPFGEVVASVAAASATAYRHGRYRPAELVAAQARMDRRRGVVTVPTIEYNCYSWPREFLVPAPSTPPDGAATWISSAPDEPCETLYVDFSRDGGVVTLDVTVGDHLLDAGEAAALPVRLCGFLRALAEGAECPVPARPLTPAAPGWWRAPQGWVHLPTVEDVLRGHPGVLDVTVTPSVYATEAGGAGDEEVMGEEPHLVVRARTAPDVTPEDVHRHVLDHLGEVPGLLAPGRYHLSPSGPGTDRPPGPARTPTGGPEIPRIPSRPPATDAERALAAAVMAVVTAAEDPGGPPSGSSGGPDSPDSPDSYAAPDTVDMNRSLADHGVTLVAVPPLLALLHRSGFTGIASDELAGTASLGHLATALEPVRPRRAPRAPRDSRASRESRGGETSP